MTKRRDLLGNINLKLLHTFILVAEHRSFRFAAEETLRSQSAVSTQIKQLEEQLGVSLFHRTTRHVTLTKEGELLLSSAKIAMLEVQSCLRSIHETANMQNGRVALACSPTIASTQLGLILAVFEKDFPTIDIVVRELNPTELLASVGNQEVDFAIGPVVPAPEFDFEKLYDDELYALVPNRFDRSSQETITLKDLATKPLLLLNTASALRALLESAFKERGLKFQTRHQFSQAQTLVAMAESSLGVAVLTEISLPVLKSKHYKVRRIIEPRLSREVALIKLRGKALPPAAARLAQLVRDLTGSQPKKMAKRKGDPRKSIDRRGQQS